VDLSVGKLVAGALGATAAAVVTAAFSVQGTLVGAAVMSVVWTVTTAVLDHSVSNAQKRMRERTMARRSGEEEPSLPGAWKQRLGLDRLRLGLDRLRNVRWREIRWRRVAAASALVFAVAAGSITAYEALTGEPVAAQLGGAPSGASDPSLLWLVGQDGSASDPEPAPPSTTSVPTTSVPATPTPEPPAVTPAPAPSVLVTPEPPATPATGDEPGDPEDS
jgi:hypothetical protein